MGLNAEVPHLAPPHAPSSSLLHLAGPSLPPCWPQKTTCRDTQFGEAFGAPHPCPGLPPRGSGVRRQLEAKCPIPTPPPVAQGLILLFPLPLCQAPGHLCQRPHPLQTSPQADWEEPCSHLLVHDGASQLLHMGQLRGGGQQHKFAGQTDLDVEGDPGARSWDLGQLWWRRLQLQAAGGRRRPRPGRAWEPGEMGRGGGHGRGGAGGVPGPAARRPPGMRLMEPGEPGSLDPRELVSWWWERGDPGDTRKEI